MRKALLSLANSLADIFFFQFAKMASQSGSPPESFAKFFANLLVPFEATFSQVEIHDE